MIDQPHCINSERALDIAPSDNSNTEFITIRWEIVCISTEETNERERFGFEKVRIEEMKDDIKGCYAIGVGQV